MPELHVGTGVIFGILVVFLYKKFSLVCRMYHIDNACKTRIINVSRIPSGAIARQANAHCERCDVAGMPSVNWVISASLTTAEVSPAYWSGRLWGCCATAE